MPISNLQIIPHHCEMIVQPSNWKADAWRQTIVQCDNGKAYLVIVHKTHVEVTSDGITALDPWEISEARKQPLFDKVFKKAIQYQKEISGHNDYWADKAKP